jgi:membrane protein
MGPPHGLVTGDLLSRLPAPARNLATRLLDTWPGRIVERGARALIDIEVFDRSMTLAAQAFTSVFPLLILVATLRPRQSHNQLGSALADSLGLNTQARETLEAALPKAGSAASTFGVIGALVVLISATSFSRALVRMYVRIWQAPRPSALRGYWRLFAVLFGVITLLVLLTLVRRVLSGVPFSGVAEAVVSFVLGCLLWTWTPWVLLARQVPMRMLVPGGVLMAVCMIVLSIAGGIYLPIALSSATRQFGALGVSFTYVTWLFVIMIALVGSTTIGAVIARDAGPLARYLGIGAAR